MNKYIKWLKGSCIFLAFLGITHLAATVFIVPMFQNLAKEQFLVFLFMYFAAGIGTILPGVISWISTTGLNTKNKNSRNIILICAAYSLLMGVGAIITMNDNPFAYLMFLSGLSLLTPAILINRNIKKTSKNNVL